MPQVTESTVVGGPVGEVWALLRDFAAIGDWHPALPPAEIENGPADRVGCVRVFPLAGGHRETLTGLDDQRRRIAFTFADHAAGLPVRSYTSAITARSVSLSDHAYVEWSSRFDCDEADEDKAIAAIRDGVLVPGLRALEQRFGPPTLLHAEPRASHGFDRRSGPVHLDMCRALPTEEVEHQLAWRPGDARRGFPRRARTVLAVPAH